jgi:hypothetical protein
LGDGLWVAEDLGIAEGLGGEERAVILPIVVQMSAPDPANLLIEFCLCGERQPLASGSSGGCSGAFSLSAHRRSSPRRQRASAERILRLDFENFFPSDCRFRHIQIVVHP